MATVAVAAILSLSSHRAIGPVVSPRSRSTLLGLQREKITTVNGEYSLSHCLNGG